MERDRPESPFGDLPESLVEEMLSRHVNLGEKLSASLRDIFGKRDRTRELLKAKQLLKSDSSIIGSHLHPTTCGVDGSYAVERLVASDIAAVAGVAVEGLTPPTETRLWPQPHHLSRVVVTPHQEATGLLMRAIMITMELELAASAPHDVVFLDGSLTTPVIHFNQAFNRLKEENGEIATILLDRIEKALNHYEEILQARRSDKIYVGVPKYTTRNEISRMLGFSAPEDRGVLSFVLDPGEVVGPIDMIQSHEDWHFSGLTDDLSDRGREIISLISQLIVLYYKPHELFPTLRVEMSPVIARNQQRLSILLESLQLQCAASGIMEPFPLYLADRMVKHLSKAVPAIRKATAQHMAENFAGETGSIFLAMHGYRTESDR